MAVLKECVYERETEILRVQVRRFSTI